MLRQKDESNSLSPYDIVNIDGGYSFTTSIGLVYQVYFYKYIDGLPIYSFSFDVTNSENFEEKKMDSRIRITICHILKRFFELDERAMIYVCDSLDGREKGRYKLFSSWYIPYQDEYDNYSMVNEEIGFYSAMIVRKDNILKQHLFDQFFQFQEEMNG